MKFFFIFFSATLFATVNEPLRWEIFSGYRNDRIHWHIQDPGDEGEVSYRKIYRDVESWINGVSLKVIARDLTFFLKGVYGAGLIADAFGYFGYAVNLTADRTYKVILTPLIGYGAYFQEQKKFKQLWNGFSFGGQFSFETGGPVLLNAGYSYNLLHNRVHAEIPLGRLKTSSSGNRGQVGWAQIDWNFKCYWRVGLGGQIQYFTTRVVDAILLNMDQKFKLRWTPISGWMQISRTF